MDQSLPRPTRWSSVEAIGQAQKNAIRAFSPASRLVPSSRSATRRCSVVPGVKAGNPAALRVVAGDELVVAGKCFWDDRFSRQPLLIRSLRGGRWHVLRWLAGEYEPILAAEGSLLAVGVQHSLAQMTVSIFDLRDGRVQSHLTLPDGHLSFASGDRLVLSSPVLREPDDVCFPVSEPCEPYRRCPVLHPRTAHRRTGYIT